MTFTINKEYSKSTIKAPRNSTKTLPKSENDMTEIFFASLLSYLDSSHTKYNASSIYLDQTSARRVNVQLIFKNIRGNKRSILNVYLKKSRSRFNTMY